MIKIEFLSKLILTAIFITAGGCATNDLDRTRAQGAAVGCAIGGALEKLIDGDKSSTKRALRACALGAIAGGVYGDHVAAKKERFAKREDYLNALIAEGKRVLELTRRENRAMMQQTDVLELEIAALQNSSAATAQKVEQLKRKKMKAKGIRDSGLVALERLETEIKIQQAALEEERKEMAKSVKRENESSKNLLNVGFEQASELEREQQAYQLALARLAAIEKSRVYR